MSGHSKWSTIKHKKAKTDAQRGKQFSKVVREIMVSAKLGGADPSMNPRLRLALQKAKEVNMPNDNIKRAIQKGAGNEPESQLEELIYEAYGPNGVAVLIKTLTDNRNRTVSNLKSTLTRCGGRMVEKGSVSYLFSAKGLIIFGSGSPEDQIMEVAFAMDIDDFDVQEDGSIEIITSPQIFEELKASFDTHNLSYVSACLTMLPSTFISISDKDCEQMISFIEKLEEDDDVQEVYANFCEED